MDVVSYIAKTASASLREKRANPIVAQMLQRSARQAAPGMGRVIGGLFGSGARAAGSGAAAGARAVGKAAPGMMARNIKPIVGGTALAGYTGANLAQQYANSHGGALPLIGGGRDPMEQYSQAAGQYAKMTDPIQREIQQALSSNDFDRAMKLQEHLQSGNLNLGGRSFFGTRFGARDPSMYDVQKQLDANNPDSGIFSSMASGLHRFFSPWTAPPSSQTLAGQMATSQQQAQEQYNQQMLQHQGEPDKLRGQIQQLQEMQQSGVAMTPQRRQLLEQQMQMLRSRMAAPRSGESATAAAQAARMRASGMHVQPFQRPAQQPPPQLQGQPDRGGMTYGGGWLNQFSGGRGVQPAFNPYALNPSDIYGKTGV